MELVSILLSGVFAFVSLGGIAVDRGTETAIRNRLARTEEIQVRVDNAPTHQILNGRADRLRLSGRGLWISDEIRVDRFEVETDRLNVEQNALREADIQKIRELLIREPLNAGVKAEITEADINRALQSTEVLNRIQRAANNILNSAGGNLGREYLIQEPRVRLLGNDRTQIDFRLADSNSGEKLNFSLETGIKIADGQKLNLVDPSAKINGVTVPPFLLNGAVSSINDRVNVALVQEGVDARILNFKIEPQRIIVAGFIRITPKNR